MGESKYANSRVRQLIRRLGIRIVGRPVWDLSETPGRTRDDPPLPNTAERDEGEVSGTPSVDAALLADGGPTSAVEGPRQTGPEAAEPDEAPADPDLEEALLQIRRCQWGRAQRVLEDAIGHGQSTQAQIYLADVRAIRRRLRLLQRRPRDAALYLELGKLYFGLELGDEALHEFHRAVQLDSGLAQGHLCLAMEYLFRGEEDVARAACERAIGIDASLPSFEALRSTLMTGEAAIRAEQAAGTPTVASA